MLRSSDASSLLVDQQFWAEQERIDKEKDDLRLQKERDLFVNPRTGEDFEFLYQQLEDWRMKEVMTIEMGGSEGMDRRKLVEKLLDKVRTHTELH